ncbi:MAG: hypothetical protein E7323_06915 [Clostridiales bacterium]|nr:hypothetical protein [Clostridiales bacterium]
MKYSFIRLVCVIVLLILPVFSFAETTGFSDQQNRIYEAIKWSDDFPKSAQVTNAVEYLCKIDDYQVNLLLVQATQNEMIASHKGSSSTLMLIDLDSDAVITYTNCVWPETPDINTKDDLLNMLFACWDSYTMGYNPFVYTEFEITNPMPQEEIAAVNMALSAYFSKPE